MLIACAAFAVLGWILRRSGRQAKLSPWLIAADLALSGTAVPRMALCNLGHSFVTHGSVAELRKLCGLDGESLCRKAMEVCTRG